MRFSILLLASLIYLGSTLETRGGMHWAFQQIKKPGLPSVQNKAWPRTPIDYFILEKLEKANLKPAPPATAHDIGRRISYGLIGLPPEQGTDMDELMSSPRYGEKWARHWLDIVRYADSNGLDENAAHANAWRYRDYVVEAFNSDKPFNQFLMEQIAGDLLPFKDHAHRRELLIATGFLSMGPKVLAEPDKTKMEMDIIDEQIDTLGKSVLGLTLGCARCHDHKFDPIPTSEYYGLAGIFKGTKTMKSWKTIAKWHENSLASPKEKKLREEHQKLVEAQKKVIKDYVNRANQQLLVDTKLKKLPSKPDKKYPEATREELNKLREKLNQLEANPTELPSAMGVIDGNATELPIFLRGDHATPGEIQPRRFPRAISDGRPIEAEGSGRLELGRWISDKNNPLTARVFVNRVWRWHFGRGLVATTDNFGTLGTKPSHPKLLDWLASWFVENGWSLKKLNHLILDSATFRMSSEATPDAENIDPENKLLSRAPLRRLEAEQLRDTLLEIPGLLDKKLGGTVWRFENYKLVFNHTSEDGTNYESNRRALYLPVIRNHVYDLFELFDFPDPGTVNGNRGNSTIAPQALYLMNSPLVLRTADELGNHLIGDKACNDQGRVTKLYRKVFNRNPNPEENERAQAFINDFSNDRQSSWQALCQALVSSNEFLYLK